MNRMIVIQVLISLFLLFAFLGTMVRFRERKITVGWFVFWSLFWIAGGVVVMVPEIMSRLATLVGVARGVDLVVYVAILALFYMVFRILVKIESLEHDITKVVRQRALEDDKNL